MYLDKFIQFIKYHFVSKDFFLSDSIKLNKAEQMSAMSETLPLEIFHHILSFCDSVTLESFAKSFPLIVKDYLSLKFALNTPFDLRTNWINNSLKFSSSFVDILSKNYTIQYSSPNEGYKIVSVASIFYLLTYLGFSKLLGKFDSELPKKVWYHQNNILFLHESDHPLNLKLNKTTIFELKDENVKKRIVWMEHIQFDKNELPKTINDSLIKMSSSGDKFIQTGNHITNTKKQYHFTISTKATQWYPCGNSKILVMIPHPDSTNKSLSCLMYCDSVSVKKMPVLYLDCEIKSPIVETDKDKFVFVTTNNKIYCLIPCLEFYVRKWNCVFIEQLESYKIPIKCPKTKEVLFF